MNGRVHVQLPLQLSIFKPDQANTYFYPGNMDVLAWFYYCLTASFYPPAEKNWNELFKALVPVCQEPLRPDIK